MGAKTGGFLELIDAPFQNLAPFVFVIKVEDLIDDVIFSASQAQSVQKALVEAIAFRGKLGIRQAGAYGFPKTQLAVYCQYLSGVIPQGEVG